MPILKSAAIRLFSASYTLVFVALALLALHVTHYDLNKLFLYFLLPFYLLSLALQYVLPKVSRPLEKNELLTDMVSNASVMLINTVQAAIVAWAFHHMSSSLLVSAGWVGPQWSLASLPFALQVLAGLLVFDFMFYVTHRLCHEWPLLWRFHAVHHSAHRVTFLNAYRAHPVDVVVRRFIPLAPGRPAPGRPQPRSLCRRRHHRVGAGHRHASQYRPAPWLAELHHRHQRGPPLAPLFRLYGGAQFRGLHDMGPDVRHFLPAA
ncbi:MAG TPA: sterol desaturase family protein [Moraxellaceae bacterium]